MRKILLIDTHGKSDGFYGGIGYYRLIKPKQYLEPLGYEFESWDATQVSGETPSEILESYTQYMARFDAVLSKTNSNEVSLSYMLLACKKAGTYFITDLDDNFMEVLPSQPAWELGFQKGQKERTVIGVQLSMSDALFVSTQPLKDYYEKFLREAFKLNTPIYILPNGNDVADWQYKSETNKRKVTIGWMGSVTHDQDLALAMPAVSKLMDKRKNVHFEVMGGATPKTFANQNYWSDDALNRVKGVKGTQSFKGFPKTLMGHRWDIGIAPLIDCEFNRGKSHIKWMEYAMKKIPTVASNVYPYSSNIENWKTGVLVEQNWYDALESLVLDKEKRDEIGNAAFGEVAANHQYKDLAPKWDAALQGVLNSEKNATV